MTKNEVAKLVESMPQNMNADDYIVELVNRALFLEREACAKLVSDKIKTVEGIVCAAEIKARGDK